MPQITFGDTIGFGIRGQLFRTSDSSPLISEAARIVNTAGDFAEGEIGYVYCAQTAGKRDKVKAGGTAATIVGILWDGDRYALPAYTRPYSTNTLPIGQNAAILVTGEVLVNVKNDDPVTVASTLRFDAATGQVSVTAGDIAFPAGTVAFRGYDATSKLLAIYVDFSRI